MSGYTCTVMVYLSPCGTTDFVTSIESHYVVFFIGVSVGKKAKIRYSSTS